MSIIYSYPQKSNPANADLLLISDSADSNATKQITVESIKATTAGVTKIIAGPNITISPTSGLGDVTIETTTAAVSSVTAIAAGTSTGTPVAVTPTTGAVTIQSMKFNGGANVGHVPDASAAAAESYLKNDGTWALTPTNITLTTTGVSGASSWDGTTLNIPQYNSDTYVAATSGDLGLLKLGSDIDITAAYETGTAGTGVSNRAYPVQFNASDQAAVYVPWVDTNTTSITLTTTGTSGASTWDGTTLNIPQYADGNTNIANTNLTLTGARTLELGTYSLQVNGDDEFRFSNYTTDVNKIGVRVDYNLKCGGQAYSILNDKGTTGGAVAIDWNDGNVQSIDMNANTTITISNANPGATYILIISQPVGQAYTLTWPASIDWHNNNTAPGVITAERTDVYTFVCRTASSLLGTYAEDFIV